MLTQTDAVLIKWAVNSLCNAIMYASPTVAITTTQRLIFEQSLDFEKTIQQCDFQTGKVKVEGKNRGEQ